MFFVVGIVVVLVLTGTFFILALIKSRNENNPIRGKDSGLMVELRERERRRDRHLPE